MKPLVYVYCLVFGHNKVLEVTRKNGNSTYFSKCSQCEKKWHHKDLSDKPKPPFQTQQIKMRGHGQKMAIKITPVKIQPKKQKVNIYVL